MKKNVSSLLGQTAYSWKKEIKGNKKFLAKNKKRKITPTQKNVLKIIYNSIKSSGFAPTLTDLKVDLKVSSEQTVLKFLDKLEKKQLIRKKEGDTCSLQLLPLGYKEIDENPLIQVVGTSAAGPYIESYSSAFTEWQSVEPEIWGDDGITKSNDRVFIVRVQGNSMINIGIDNDDMLLVKETGEFKSGDIVVAETDYGTTIKRFVIENNRIYLQPENPDYKTMIIDPEEVNFKGRVVLNLSKVAE